MQSDINMLKRAAICGLILLILSIAGYAKCTPDLQFQWNDSRAEYSRKIDAFLVDFFSKCNPKKLQNARQIVPILIDVCEAEGVNPAIVASIVSYESTWRTEAMGKIGEVGLMQVVGSTANDARSQLFDGIRRLKLCYEECKNIEGALSLYATGKSCRVYRGAELRMKMARKIEAM